MKYYVRYADDIGADEEFSTPEEAFASIPARADRTGNTSPMRLKEYRVYCGTPGPGAVLLTTPPVNATFKIEADPKGISAFSTAPFSIPPADVAAMANPKKAYGDKKLPVHLVPPALVLGTALNMGDGAEKYGAFNWRKSKVETMTYLGAIQRHLASYIDGEDVDPESKRGATHLGAIAACVAILMDAGNNGQLIDNRPPRGKAGDVIRRAAGVVLPKPEESK